MLLFVLVAGQVSILCFLSPAHEVGAGDIVITMSGRAAVWPCGRASLFRFRTISQKPLAGLLSYCMQTSLRGVDVPFEGYDL